MKIVSNSFARSMVSVLVLCVLAISGQSYYAAEKPKTIDAKDIDTFEFVISTAEAGMLIPGTSYPFDVQMTDNKGKKYSLKEGSLFARDVRIQSDQVQIQPDGLTIAVASDVAKMPQGTIQLEVSYGPIKKPYLKKQEYKADLAYVLGPEPQDVQEFSVETGTEGDGALIVPGDTIPVQITIKDKKGRTYSAGRQKPALPVDRLSITAENMDWAPAAMTLTASKDRSSIGKSDYKLAVAYHGRDDLTFSRTFKPDLSAIDGPKPEDVRKLAIDVDVPVSGRIVPGSGSAVTVTAVDKNGREYSTRSDARFRIPRNQLVLSGTNASFTNANFDVHFNSDAAAMVGAKFTISAKYAGNASVVAEKSFEPNLRAPFESLLLNRSEIVFAGSAGDKGTAGSSGSFGRDGTNTSAQYATGGSGSSGGRGGTGRPGGRGERGQKLLILAAKVLPIDGSEPYVVFELKRGDQAEIHTRHFSDPPLHVVSGGGRGGAGGDGGVGGHGGQGGNGYNTGDGGNGGDGGRGGNGGRGGDGGDITLVGSDSDVLSLFELESIGGEGGRPGRGGSGGEYGKAGSAFSAMLGGMAAIFGGNTNAPRPILGDLGQSGSKGDDGDEGQEGQPGIVTKEVGSVVGLMNKMPADLKKSIKSEAAPAPTNARVPASVEPEQRVAAKPAEKSASDHSPMATVSKKLLERVGPWECPDAPPKIDATSCIRDTYVAAAVMNAWARECYIRNGQTAEANQVSADITKHLGYAKELCSSAPVIAPAKACNTETIASCSELNSGISGVKLW